MDITVYVPPPVYPIAGSSCSNRKHLCGSLIVADAFFVVRWSMCRTTRFLDEKVTTATRAASDDTVKSANSFLTNFNSLKKFSAPTEAEESTRKTLYIQTRNNTNKNVNNKKSLLS